MTERRTAVFSSIDIVNATHRNRWQTNIQVLPRAQQQNNHDVATK
jgi:hypothetical protein